MLRILLIVFLLLSAGVVSAQDTPTPTETGTPTNTPTNTPTATDVPSLYMTMAPGAGTAIGQMTRFDYTSTAGDVHIANLLTWLLYSLWGMFFFVVFVLWNLARRKQ